MCELFGMSSRLPANVTLSLEEFIRHGGAVGPHADGWGIAYYEGKDVRVLRDTAAAATSACARFVQEHDLRSTLVIAHVRRATVGAVTLANTQPFCRQLGGRMHVFAHNGNLPGLSELGAAQHFAFHRPVGDTDSEVAFCLLLARLTPLWQEGVPSLASRSEVVRRFAEEIRLLGPANFLYSDGDVLFAHGHRRTHEPHGEIRPPGLYAVRRSCVGGPHRLEGEGLTIASDHPADQEVSLVASVPLTAEHWAPMGEGEIATFREGLPAGS